MNTRNKKTIKDKILKDIGETGYPSELKAGKILEKYFLEVRYNVLLS